MPVIPGGRGPLSRSFLERLPGPIQGLVDTVLPADDPMLPSPPMMAAGAAKGPLRHLLRLFGREVPNAAPPRMPPTMDLIEEGPIVRQVAPAADDVDALLGDMRRNLAKIPQRAPAPIPRPPIPEFAAVGEEGAVNAGRSGQQMVPDIYEMIKARMGGRSPR